MIRQTLELFIELTTFGNGKMLLTLEAVNYILTHHTVRNRTKSAVIEPLHLMPCTGALVERSKSGLVPPLSLWPSLPASVTPLSYTSSIFLPLSISPSFLLCCALSITPSLSLRILPLFVYPPSPRPQAEHFAFLNGSSSGPYRTLFYGTLARLLYLEDTSERFEVSYGIRARLCQGIERHKWSKCVKGAGRGSLCCLVTSSLRATHVSGLHAPFFGRWLFAPS